MSGRKRDIAIVGGGLSGGLIALAVSRARPDSDVIVLEAGETLGGNHRWSWFASDLTPAGRELMKPFRATRWDDGYEVRFPNRARHLPTPYRSLASREFDAGLRRLLNPEAIRCHATIAEIDGHGVTLEDGERIAARTVIDCRGFAATPHLRGGWQVFLGRHMRTERPHRMERPLIMDGSVEQPGACRFVYVLPLGVHDLFIEDTYYLDRPELDRAAFSRRIDEYCAAHGWDGDILGSETGVLPVVTGGDFGAFQAAQRIANVGVAGARGGFVHPLTSYTLPFAVETALAIADNAELPGEQMAAMLESRARSHWRRTRFYRRLGRMFFGAAAPDKRWRMFAHAYAQRQPVIERFYAGRSTMMDKASLLCGKPPVPVLGAMGALTSRSERLAA